MGGEPSEAQPTSMGSVPFGWKFLGLSLRCPVGWLLSLGTIFAETAIPWTVSGEISREESGHAATMRTDEIAVSKEIAPRRATTYWAPEATT